MSQQESGSSAIDESHLLLKLNKRLSVHGATVSNLKEDLQDGFFLLTLLNQASIQGASNFNKRKEGRPLSETHAMENRRTLCKILNKHKKYASFQEFREAEIFTLHATKAVHLALCILNEGQEAKASKAAKETPREKHDIHAAHTTEPILEWINYYLSKIGLQAQNLEQDLHDGFFLIHLIEIIAGKKIFDFHSRLAMNEPVETENSAADNHECLRLWLKSENESVESTRSTEPTALFRAVVWKLISISLGVEKIEKSSASRIKVAKYVFSELGIPFFFRHIDLKKKGTEVLLTASILKDKFESLKAGDKGKNFTKWAAPPRKYETMKSLDDRILEEGVLRIFLSSTFRDMQHERDEFFTNGAPKLKSLTKSKGLDLVFIDLRWGLTAEESGDGLVVIRCCDSIKKCAYFVCILGARYGWIPDRNKTELNKQERLEELKKTKPDATMKDVWVEWHSTTNQLYPFLDAMPNLSVTEYEIQYATLIDKPACSRGLFYFRDEQFAIDNALTEDDRKLYRWESDADLKLSSEEKQKARRCQDKLKAKIASKFGAVTYQGPANFSDLVTSHLTHLIDKDFSGRQVREPEDQAHHQFMQHRLAGFEGRQELLKTIVGQVDEQLESREKQITVLAAESGIGKSSLMAATVRDLNKLKRQDMSIFFHFVGCTNLSNYVESISIRFWRCLIESNSLIKSQVKDRTEADFQNEGIQGLFKFLEMNIPNHKFVFLIDAINQLHPSQETPVPHLLTWLPKKAPKNVALVVSTIDTHASCKTIQSMKIATIPVTKLKKPEIEQGTNAFLNRYDKKASKEQMQLILDDAQDTGHPLYLRLVLEEIRIFGVYEELTEELKKLLKTDGVVDLYNMIITRWENKFNKENAKMVEIAMKVLFVSRIGLSEGDLDKYISENAGIKFNLAEWKSFFFTLIESLFVRNGRYMYFHQLLLETVKEKYLNSDQSLKAAQKEYGTWLHSQYTDAKNVDEEVVAEICYQLLSGDSYDALIEYLKNEHVVESMLGGRYRYEFFNCWRKIHEKGAGNYKDTYKSLVQSLTKAGDLLVDFFLEAFENSFLISTIPARMTKRSSEESKAGDYLTLGRVYKKMECWDESLQNLKRCMGIKALLKKRDESMASILDEIGRTYLKQIQFEEASRHFSESLNLRKELFGESDVRVAQSFDNIGRLRLNQKMFTDSIEAFTRARDIRAKAVGQDHPLMATSLKSLAKVDIAENRLDIALRKLDKAKQIWESSLGSKHHSVASALCLIASIFEKQDQQQKAVGLLDQASKILIESMGENHRNTVSTFEKIGNLKHDMKKHRDALIEYNKVLVIRKRTVGNKHADYATALENVARTNFELKRYDQVTEFITPAVNIRLGTKTKPSFKDGAQRARIAELMKNKKLEEEAVFLNSQSRSDESWDAWNMCNSVDEKYKSTKKHQEAIIFWAEIRDTFEENLGVAHERTLLCCQYLAFHSKKTGQNKQAIEFTRVAKFIYEETGTQIDDDKFELEKVSALLFSIIYSSRTDVTKSKAASIAITLLNFMNVPFSGLDLSGVRIPTACLKQSILQNVDFTGADLSGVNFKDANIRGCKLDKVKAESLNFGQLPKIPHSEKVFQCCNIMEADQTFLYTSCEKSVYVFDLESCTSSQTDIKLPKRISCMISFTSGTTGFLITGDEYGNVVISDAYQTNEIHRFVLKEDFQVTSMVAIPFRQNLLNSESPFIAAFYLICSNMGGNMSLYEFKQSKVGVVECDLIQKLQMVDKDGIYRPVVSMCVYTEGEIYFVIAAAVEQLDIYVFLPDYARLAEPRRNCISLEGENVSVIQSIRYKERHKIAVGSKKSILIYDTQNMDAHLQKMTRDDGKEISDLKWVPPRDGEDPNFIVATYRDRRLVMWSVEEGQIVRSFQGHSESITKLSVFGFKQENYVMGTCDDKNAWIWSLFAGEQLKKASGHQQAVNALDMYVNDFDKSSSSGSNLSTASVSTDRNWVQNLLRKKGVVVTGSSDGNIKVWDYATGICRATLPQKGMVPMLVLTKLQEDEFRLYYRLGKEKCIYFLDPFTSEVNTDKDTKLDADEDVKADESPDESPGAKKYGDRSSPRNPIPLQGQPTHFMIFEVHNRKFLATACMACQVCEACKARKTCKASQFEVFDVLTHEPVFQLDLEVYSFSIIPTPSNSNRLIVICTSNHQASCFYLDVDENGEFLKPKPICLIASSGYTEATAPLLINSDGEKYQFVSSERNGMTFKFTFDLSDGGEEPSEEELLVLDDPIFCSAFVEIDGLKYYVFGDKNGYIRICKMDEEFSKVYEEKQHNQVRSLMYRAQDRTLVSTGEDGTMYLWIVNKPTDSDDLKLHLAWTTTFSLDARDSSYESAEISLQSRQILDRLNGGRN